MRSSSPVRNDQAVDEGERHGRERPHRDVRAGRFAEQEAQRTVIPSQK